MLHHSRITAVVWVALGLLGFLAGVWDLWRGGWLGSRSTGDVFLLAVSVAAAAGGAAAWRKRRYGRYLLGGVAILMGLYCIAFQLLVRAEFGWIWFTATLVLLAFSIFTIWSQSRSLQRA